MWDVEVERDGMRNLCNGSKACLAGVAVAQACPASLPQGDQRSRYRLKSRLAASTPVASSPGWPSGHWPRRPLHPILLPQHRHVTSSHGVVDLGCPFFDPFSSSPPYAPTPWCLWGRGSCAPSYDAPCACPCYDSGEPGSMIDCPSHAALVAPDPRCACCEGTYSSPEPRGLPRALPVPPGWDCGRPACAYRGWGCASGSSSSLYRPSFLSY